MTKQTNGVFQISLARLVLLNTSVFLFLFQAGKENKIFLVKRGFFD